MVCTIVASAGTEYKECLRIERRRHGATPNSPVIEPVEVQRFALAALSAGAVVLFGACYAVFLALGRLNSFALLRRLANVSYAALAASVGGLAWFLRLDGAWLALVVLLLAGYFVAPRFIWRLSVATHDSADEQGGHRV